MKFVNNYADNGGCGCYRVLWPANLIQSIKKNLDIVNCKTPIVHEDYYKSVRAVRIQRKVSADDLKYVQYFLKPLCNKLGIWLTYDIDDVLGAKDIPTYNKNQRTYNNPDFFYNIKQIMNCCDYVTVSTQELKQYFVNKFGINKRKIVVLKNYMPKWWIDSLYHEKIIEDRINEIIANKRKPNILFASSLSHYDVNGNNDYIDDYTHIIDFIIKNLDTYDFTFVGGLPNQLIPYQHKITTKTGFEISTYPKEIFKLNPDLIITPLMDNIFNRCKSNIKVIEFGALGIPNICQNISTYNKYTDLLFNDSIDLEKTVQELLSDKQKYMETVTKAYQFVQTGNDGKSWFLEDNITEWLQLYEFPQKTINVNLKNVNNQKITQKQPTVYSISDRDFCKEEEQ